MSIPHQNCKRAGCSQSQSKVFQYLIDHQGIPITQKQIAEDLGLMEAQIRPLIGFLVDKSLVKFTKGVGYTVAPYKIYYTRIKSETQ